MEQLPNEDMLTGCEAPEYFDEVRDSHHMCHPEGEAPDVQPYDKKLRYWNPIFTGCHVKLSLEQAAYNEDSLLQRVLVVAPWRYHVVPAWTLSLEKTPRQWANHISPIAKQPVQSLKQTQQRY